MAMIFQGNKNCSVHEARAPPQPNFLFPNRQAIRQIQAVVLLSFIYLFWPRSPTNIATNYIIGYYLRMPQPGHV